MGWHLLLSEIVVVAVIAAAFSLRAKNHGQMLMFNVHVLAEYSPLPTEKLDLSRYSLGGAYLPNT